MRQTSSAGECVDERSGMGTGSKDVTIAKLSSNTGAEVTGVDLTQSLQPELGERFTRAFVERSVLVIRDQKLDAPEFLAAMQNFGEIVRQENRRVGVPECPLVHYISNQDKLEDGRVYIPGGLGHCRRPGGANARSSRSFMCAFHFVLGKPHPMPLSATLQR